MADAPNPDPNPTTDPTPAPEPDPLAGFDEPTKARIQDAETTWSRLSPAERATAIEFARIENARRAIPPDEKPKAKESTPAPDDDNVPLTRAELKAYKAEQEAKEKAREERAATEKGRAQWFGALDDELDRNPMTKENAKLRKAVRFAMIGEAVEAPQSVSDIRAAVKARAAELEDAIGEESKKYVDGKRKARDEAGEGRGGRTIPVEKYHAKPTDIGDGTTKERAMKRIAELRSNR